MSNKFRAVKGILPKKADISDWSADKIEALLIFASLALRERIHRGKTERTFNYDKQFQQVVKQYDNPFFEEFTTRIEYDANMSYLGMRGRLTTMVRTVLAYLKSNPHAVTENMEAIMKTTERFSWALNNFKAKETKIGATVLVVDNEETTDMNRKNVVQEQTNLTMPEVQFNKSILLASSLLLDILKGIKKNDLKTMDTKDRLRIALPMFAVLSKALNVKKPKSLIFKQLNVNTSNKDDLERALLEYGQNQ